MKNIFPLSFAQEARLIAEEVASRRGDARAPNHFPIAISIHGPVSRDAIRQSLHDVLIRHAALRAAYFQVDHYSDNDRRMMLSLFSRRAVFVPGMFAQSIADDTSLPITWRDVSLESGPTEDAMARLAEEEGRRPLVWRDGPLVRAVAYTFDKNTHLLVLVLSHVSVDGWSVGIIKEELAAAIAARAADRSPELQPVKAQAPDFALAEHNAFRTGAFDEALSYWRTLSTEPVVAFIDHCELPAWLKQDRPWAIRAATAIVDESMTTRVRQLCRGCRITCYVFCRAIFALLLHGYTSRTRVSLWANFANRRIAGGERLVANCATQHPLTSELLSGDTVMEFCSQIAAGIRQGQRHEGLSRAALRLMSRSVSPRGDTRVVFDTWPGTAASVPGSIAVPLRLPAARPWVDLDVRVQDNGRTLALIVTFDEGRYSGAGVSVMLDQFRELIEQGIADMTRPARELAEVAAGGAR